MPRAEDIRIRRGTLAQWVVADGLGRLLGAGEPGFTTDTRVMKIGDGVTTFALLPSVASFTGHDAQYFRAGDLGGGTAALNTNNAAVGFGKYWLFDDTAPEFVSFEWYPPVHWTAYVMRIGFLAAGAGGNNVVWRADVLELGFGGNPAAAKVAQAQVTLAGPALLGTGWSYGDIIGSAAVPKVITPLAQPVQMVSINRVAGDVGDTMVGDAGLAIVTVTRIAT